MGRMKHFLLVFDRTKGELLKITPYSSRSRAMRARFDAERLHQAEPWVEVVVLNGTSEEAVRRTHSRYFNDAREIARQGIDRISETNA
jgi:hypothetical protein